MCLVSVTEPHAFKVRPGCSVGQHQPFRGQAGACCVVSPLPSASVGCPVIVLGSEQARGCAGASRCGFGVCVLKTCSLFSGLTASCLPV